MKNKRGQFYLIAAIIIIGVVLTSVATSNYVRTKKERYPIYNIGDIVDFETAKVFDYGIVSGEELEDLMFKWITNYTSYGSKSVTGDWLFIYTSGGSSGRELNALIINESTSGTIGFDWGDGTPIVYEPLTSHIVKITGLESKINENNEIEFEIMGEPYTFEIKEGQNFYFVITTGNQTISN